MYADSITKSFLSYANPSDTQQAKSAILDHQDPTYIGFYLEIVPSLNLPDDYDDLPHGLFTSDPKVNPYSTYNYLISRGEYLRASYILAFEKDFLKLLKEAPWYFVKVSGLSDSWKIEPGNSYRGKDKKITIETLESIDMKMTYLLDLYRKAVFDATWMRWAVPDHMRYFKMNITVAEVRPMKIGTNSLLTSADGGFGLIYDRDKSNLKTSQAESNTDQDNQNGLYDTTAPWSSGTFIRFQYSQCEIDVFSEAPPFLESATVSVAEAAANKLVIKTHVIKERNVYGLLGAIIQDTASWRDYGVDTQGKSIWSPNPEAVDGNNSGVPDYEKYTNTLPPDYGAGLDQRKTDQAGLNKGEMNTFQNDGISAAQAVSDADYWSIQHGSFGETTPDSPLKAAIKRAGRNLQAGATDYVKSLVKNQINAILLGNVYGLSPGGIVGALQSIATNPASAIQVLLQKYSSPQIGREIAKNVEFTGDEAQLIASTLGRVSQPTTPTALSQLPKNENLTAPPGSLSDPISGRANMTSNLASFASAGATPKVTLESVPKEPSDLPKNVYK